MFKDSRIYVAGHAGLLGSALVKKLKSKSYNNIITRTHSELDLTDQKAVNDFFKKEQPEYVFLAAGLTGGIVANKTYPSNFLHTNIAIQDNVFQAAHKYKVKHLIFYGSSCVYPKNSIQPIKEEYLMTGEIEETSEAYAIAKIAGIIACKSYNDQFKTNCFIALIPNSMYGPNDNFDLENSHVLSALIKRFHEAKIGEKDKITLWGSGNPRREFIFSEDVADASVFAMNNAEKVQNTHYNAGTGVDYSIKELAGIISKVAGYKGEIEWDVTKPDGAPKKLLDSSRFLHMGWEPSIDIEDGIKITYEWYIKNIRKSSGADMLTERSKNLLLRDKALWVRKETLNIHKIAPETRLASSLSCVEIFVVLYYGKILNYDPSNIKWDGRDRFIISKGHGAISFYPILADLGYFDKKELSKVCKEGTFLGGIPDSVIPGFETINGSLGHGLGVACGISLALKRKRKMQKVFVLLGDGELYEGSIWEAVMFAGEHKLDNLIVIIDGNKICMIDYCKNILDLEPLGEKFKVFGWDVKTVDGHDVSQLLKALAALKEANNNKPKVLIANTIKGKGVPCLETDSLCHIKNLKPEEIDEEIDKICGLQ